MRIQITNFRGVRKAELTLDKITLVGGPNGGGKSSIAQAFGAALSGEIIPFGKMPKNAAGQLVTDGEKRAMAYIETDAGSHVTATWPDCKIVTQGETVPSASNIAAGLDTPLDWTDKERADFFSALLASEPDEAAFKAALGEVISTADIGKLMAAIETSGWDTVLATAKEKGSRLKGGWEQETGEKYGSKKAENWYPMEWSADIEGANRETLENAVTVAQEWVDAGVTDAAVGTALAEHEMAKLRELANEEPARQKALEEAAAVMKSAKADLDAAEKRLRDAGQAVVSAGQECPHCGKPLVVVRGKIAPGEVTQEQADESMMREQDARTERDRANEKHRDAYLAHTKASTALDEARNAARRLAEMPDPSSKQATTSATDLDAARTRLRTATENLAAYDAKEKADGIQEKILVNEQVVAALAPDGMRLAALVSALMEANERMADLCAYASWAPVRLEADLSITYGGRQVRLCSVSEQYRTRAIMQMFVSEKQSSSAVILDGADVLTKAGRNGLIRMLTTVGIPALVCMSLEREQYDTISAGMKKIGGHAYWIEGGIIA